MTRARRNMAASVRQRLMDQAKKRGEDFNAVLSRFGRDRLLYRLSESPHREQFVLKGAMLFQVWSGQVHRPTRDLDLLGFGDASTQRIDAIFQDICQQPTVEDGIKLHSDSILAETMKPDEEYRGVRVKLLATLASARIPLQVDIGFGDAVTPAPEYVVLPSMLDFPSAFVRAYTRETVVAEKYQAMVKLGIANSRMKDFLDIWTLARSFSFAGSVLRDAMEATFLRRQTRLPVDPPLALTGVFASDRQKMLQWKAFLAKSELAAIDITLASVVDCLRSFLLPPTLAAANNLPFEMHWTAEGGWQ